MTEHRFCPIHRVCLQCGVRADDVIRARRAEDCPGGPDTTVVAISARLSEDKTKRSLQWKDPA